MVDNHRVSYGLTAASVYARLQPSLKSSNGSSRTRQRVVPRPYKRRPVTLSSTTSSTVQSDQPEENEEEPEEEEEETEWAYDELEEEKLHPEKPEEVEKTQPEEPEVPKKVIRIDQHPPEVKEEEPEEPKQVETAPVKSDENETFKPKTAPTMPKDGQVDIKELLRNAGQLSLSEILQQKGMSLAELLKGSAGRIAPVIATAATTSTTLAPEEEPIPAGKRTGKETVPDTTTAPRPQVLPSVKPISFRELLAAKNLSLQDIVAPNLTGNNILPSSTEKSLIPGPTIKPGVKMPVPFTPGRGKGLIGLVAPPAPEEEAPKEPMTSSATSTSKPASPSTDHLKPFVFGKTSTLEEVLNSTVKPVQSKRPYVPAGQLGEYGSHLGRSYDEADDEKPRPYGANRNIATSRLTPAPPRKQQRPLSVFNYNEFLEEEEEEEEAETTTSAAILTHFNEEELNEEHTFIDLPLSVRNAIIVSSSIGGFCLLVFLVILVAFRIRQKTRIRLRHPATLLGMPGVDMTAASSDSSGITTPVSHPASKSGYAKLPRRSSSLWGTLRRSVRQMEAVHYS